MFMVIVSIVLPSKFDSQGTDPQGRTVRQCENEKCLSNCFVPIRVVFLEKNFNASGLWSHIGVCSLIKGSFCTTVLVCFVQTLQQ